MKNIETNCLQVLERQNKLFANTILACSRLSVCGEECNIIIADKMLTLLIMVYTIKTKSKTAIFVQ